jgi:hypothetical protein
MTTTPMSRIHDTARIHCAGVLDGMVRLEMFYVFKDFFERTDAWLMEIPVYVIPSTNDYTIDTCQNAVVNRLMQVDRPDNINPQICYLPGKYPQFLQLTPSGGTESLDPIFRSAREGMLLNSGTKCPILRLHWNPQSNETWVATVSLNITDPTDKDGLPDCIPDWLVEKYNQTLCDGVISKLMLQAGKPYSSPQGAEYHGKKYNQGVGTARNEARKMFVYGAQRWGYPRGWMTRTARRYG